MKLSNAMKLSRMRGRAATWRVLGAFAACLLTAGAVAACGGSSSSGSSSTKASAAKTASASAGSSKFVKCLKQHGVTISVRAHGGFAGGRRPGGRGMLGSTGAPPTGTGSTGASPTGARPSGGAGFMAGGSTKDRTAYKACAKYQTRTAFRGSGGQRPTAKYSAATLKKFVTCVRKNGYPQMPAASKTSNGGFFPKTLEKNKKFQAAAQKCMSVLQPSGSPGSSTTTTTAAS